MNSNTVITALIKPLDSSQEQQDYPLSSSQEVVIGREPSCQIVLSSTAYPKVSRYHTSIRPMAQPNNFEICDLGSGNGTFVNGQRLQGCQQLQAGDRISLGSDGPSFLFEYQQTATVNLQPPNPTISPPSPLTSNPAAIEADSFTISQLLPIFSRDGNLNSKGFLIPGTITVVFVIAMFMAIENQSLNTFTWLLGLYLAGAAFYFVYRLCGKLKPWWWLITQAIITILILVSPIYILLTSFFELFLPIPAELLIQNYNSFSLPRIFITFLFAAGLREELLKALPVFFAYFLGNRLSGRRRERLGVVEPLDGILLGAASSVGFTLFETLLNYVPKITQIVGEAVGLAIVFPRVVGAVAGHMAWSGLFGYFIGLSALKTRKRWLIIAMGYLISALLHALWNTFSVGGNYLIAIAVGVLSYAFLTAAILKARRLSPMRSQNFATRFYP